MKKIIVTNFIILFIIFIILEVIAFFISVKIESQFIGNLAYNHVFTRYFAQPTYIYYNVPSEKARPISGIDYKNKPILLFGCSVTYGNLLSDDENFSGILSKLTKRPVYNLAYDGWTVAHMLRQLENNTDIKNFDPEYVIYTFIQDQRRRLFFYQGWTNDTELYLRYTYNKDGHLVANKKHYPFYYRLQIVKNIQHFIERKKINDNENASKFMLDIFKQSSKIIKARYPNAKLIMLIYNDRDCSDDNKPQICDNDYCTFNEKEYNALSKMGFEIIDIEREANKLFCTPEYRLDDNHHPSSKMWQDFLPKLVKEYNM